MKRTDFRYRYSPEGSLAFPILVVLSACGMIVSYLALGLLSAPNIKPRAYTPSWQIDRNAVGLNPPIKRVYP